MEQEMVEFQGINFKVDFYRTYERSDPDTGFVGGWRVDVRDIAHVPNSTFTVDEMASESSEAIALLATNSLVPEMEQHLESIFNDQG